MCVVLHDPDGGHMPDGDMLADLMPIALRIAVDGSVDLSAHVFPPGIQVHSVRNATPPEVVCWQA
jgi:hypothetical protein